MRSPVVRLPFCVEPVDQRISLNAAPAAVRSATVKHAADFAAPVYQEWKESLRSGGVTWQQFQRAASENSEAWLRWLDGSGTWRASLESFINRINAESSTMVFELL